MQDNFLDDEGQRQEVVAVATETSALLAPPNRRPLPATTLQTYFRHSSCCAQMLVVAVVATLFCWSAVQHRHGSIPTTIRQERVDTVLSSSISPDEETKTAVKKDDLDDAGSSAAVFPPDFVWGVATSAYQIEGAVSEDGRGATIWDTFVHLPDTILDHSTGDVADDHYHRMKHDVKLMKESLGVRAYRFSIAWSRILPHGTGAVNPAGIEFYDALIDELLVNDIEPYVTLFHWDLPQTLQDDFGGWLDRRCVDAFVEYARVVFEHFSHKVKRFITLNEPWT